jgi:hypothetical protein
MHLRNVSQESLQRHGTRHWQHADNIKGKSLWETALMEMDKTPFFSDVPAFLAFSG